MHQANLHTAIILITVNPTSGQDWASLNDRGSSM